MYLEKAESLTVCCYGGFMRLPYEKHMKYTNLIVVKHNRPIDQQQHQ